ncbi:MAG: UDP-N-acetylmuramoyl-L-alanine--D-glutamate ligase, partial [bacterium]
ADEVILSPGISVNEPAIQQAKEAGATIIGDIELFAREATAPIVAITGSNGKSTVTTLVGLMCAQAGKNAGVGGNLGTPALDLLADDRDIYVLELSSFQLETTENLGAEVAVVLNVSPDHMDRYDNMISYHRAKHRIFRGAKKVVVNRDDPLSVPLLAEGVDGSFFGLRKPDLRDFGLIEEAGETSIAKGLTSLMPVSALKLKGRHNLSNALAALAMGDAAGLPMNAMLQVLKQFGGLPHRTELVAEINGVSYINDSKATNVGATKAAIEGLANGENILLLAGGDAKEQSFDSLADVCRGAVREAFVYGRDANIVAEALVEGTRVSRFDDLVSAFAAATKSAGEGDVVLLSPGCASLDQFKNYEQRGELFRELAGALR